MLPKQLFMLNSDQLVACQWRHGRLSEGEAFPADRAGMDAFSRYLRSYPDTPAWLVADMVEEDFQRQLLPHVGGRAQRAMIMRRLAMAYRDTPFRHAQIQGRDTHGRRDDHVLFSALTNPAALQPWLSIIEQRGTPLAAIYSCAFLANLLVRRLGLFQPHLLLMTLQAGGLRQSYFQGRHLKFSRLTRTELEVSDEASKMLQYLNSARLIHRGDVLCVAVLAPPSQLPQLHKTCFDTDELRFHLIGLDAAAARAGLRTVPEVADPLILAEVGRYAPPSHFACGAPGTVFQLWRTRISLHAASATVIAAASVWALGNALAASSARSETARLRDATPPLQAKLAALERAQPAGPIEGLRMVSAVKLEQLLAAKAPMPGPMMSILAAALDGAPGIELQSLDWQIQLPPTPPAASGETTPLPLEATGVAGPLPQILVAEGEVSVPGNDARAVLDAMNGLAQSLARTPRLRVETLEAPIDVRPGARYSGKTGVGPEQVRPHFKLRLTWTP